MSMRNVSLQCKNPFRNVVFSAANPTTCDIYYSGTKIQGGGLKLDDFIFDSEKKQKFFENVPFTFLTLMTPNYTYWEVDRFGGKYRAVDLSQIWMQYGAAAALHFPWWRVFKPEKNNEKLTGYSKDK